MERILILQMEQDCGFFVVSFRGPDIARKTIESVIGENGRIDSEGMFVFG